VIVGVLHNSLQILIRLRDLLEFNLENKIPKPDVCLEVWLLSLRDLKIFTISNAI
jgi:hypothetical protein